MPRKPRWPEWRNWPGPRSSGETGGRKELGNEKRQGPCLFRAADVYFDAAGAEAAGGTDAEADADAAAGLVFLSFLSFLGVDAAADADAEAEAGTEAAADADAEAEAAGAAMAEVANRETTRAASILDIFISFFIVAQRVDSR